MSRPTIFQAVADLVDLGDEGAEVALQALGDLQEFAEELQAGLQ